MGRMDQFKVTRIEGIISKNPNLAELLKTRPKLKQDLQNLDVDHTLLLIKYQKDIAKKLEENPDMNATQALDKLDQQKMQEETEFDTQMKKFDERILKSRGALNDIHKREANFSQKSHTSGFEDSPGHEFFPKGGGK